jgi:hypothetical protein
MYIGDTAKTWLHNLRRNKKDMSKTPIFDKVINDELPEPQPDTFLIPVRWRGQGIYCWVETMPDTGPGENVAMLKEVDGGKWKWTGTKHHLFDDLESAKAGIKRCLVDDYNVGNYLIYHWEKKGSNSLNLDESHILLIGKLALGAIRKFKNSETWDFYSAFDLGSSPEYQNPQKFKTIQEAKAGAIKFYCQ